MSGSRQISDLNIGTDSDVALLQSSVGAKGIFRRCGSMALCKRSTYIFKNPELERSYNEFVASGKRLQIQMHKNSDDNNSMFPF